jgi:hypothetical protein
MDFKAIFNDFDGMCYGKPTTMSSKLMPSHSTASSSGISDDRWLELTEDTICDIWTNLSNQLRRDRGEVPRKRMASNLSVMYRFKISKKPKPLLDSLIDFFGSVQESMKSFEIFMNICGKNKIVTMYVCSSAQEYALGIINTTPCLQLEFFSPAAHFIMT